MLAHSRVWKAVLRRNFPTTDLICGSSSTGETTNTVSVSLGSLLVERTVLTAANIRKWKYHENGEWSVGLSYCVSKEVPSVRRW